MTQWLIRLYAPNAEGTGLILFSLVGELRSHLPHSVTLKTKKREKEIRLVIPRIVYLFLAVLVFWSLLLLCGFLWLQRAGATLHCGV